ncbi:hypothetical protein GGTG_00440 [Gaeumannomyces tritici R3-111a-1]|uniref:FAD dependent oxidoreductase domain-containing protein n=1 Tax=Gaeumannomyces tritici (strain R3-111a-1) TaxID=644352 RepID=J3NGQ1_GAET3|nr:hypothetical protein GGTG_00440 [Gaeumannomyces tritici R3-111a-1]EJT80441.1 hypothetical protein GGTG_00440 [Gaeumannomyces tritici R3-111a-1]
MTATTPRHAAAANGNHDGEDEPPAARAGLPCANATLSPWLKEPSKRLLGHRSTAELPGSADVVVVGSGITGAFAAHFLKAGAARGQSVVMLEAREAYYRAHRAKAVRRHNGGGGVRGRELPARAGHCARGGHQVRLGRQHVPVLQRRTPDHLRRGHYRRVRRAVPRPEQAARGPAAQGGGGGGGGGWTLTTPRGDMRAAKVLLATNGYTSALLPAFADLISPVRAQACALVPKPGGAAAAAAAAAAGGGPRIDLARCAYNFVAANGSHDNYIIQRPRDGIGTGTGTGGGGELISDGARHLAPGRGVGEWRDDAADADVAAHLRALLRRVVDANSGQGKAEFGDAEDEEDVTAFDWTGVMGFSRDRIPWVGRVPESHGGGPGLFLCAAYTGRGLTVAPLCARRRRRRRRRGSSNGRRSAADDPPMSNMPAGFRIDLPGRLETVENEWPDVATIEEGGSALLLQTVIHKLMTKWCGYGDCYDGAPPELTVHGTLRTIQQAYDELVGGGGRGHGHGHVGK